MELALPYPPSVNNYWRHTGKRTYITHEGRQYRKAVAGCVLERRTEAKCCRRPMTGPLEVSVWVFPPTRGKHDLDNILK
jgi:crossover junction endodeoxyribonuclease RusA